MDVWNTFKFGRHLTKKKLKKVFSDRLPDLKKGHHFFFLFVDVSVSIETTALLSLCLPKKKKLGSMLTRSRNGTFFTLKNMLHRC